MISMKMTTYKQQLKYNEVMNYINENRITTRKTGDGKSGSEKIKESRHSVGDS